MKNRNVSPFVKIRRLENRNEIGVFDALHLIVSHGTTRKQRQTYRYSSYSSSANRRDFRIESLLTIFFYAGRTHFMRSATENAKRAKMNVLNDLMIKPILTCITGMSNTDFIPATPRIVASVIVCSFAFYCYVCIYERTFSCFFLVKKSKLGLSSEFLLIDHLNSLVRKGLFTRLFFMRACARERERERERERVLFRFSRSSHSSFLVSCCCCLPGLSLPSLEEETILFLFRVAFRFPIHHRRRTYESQLFFSKHKTQR